VGSMEAWTYGVMIVPNSRKTSRSDRSQSKKLELSSAGRPVVQCINLPPTGNTPCFLRQYRVLNYIEVFKSLTNGIDSFGDQSSGMFETGKDFQ
jgi:hypothetical protein